MKQLHIVLYEPEIPQNTGNIARTCAASGTALHLVKPLGFEINDKYLKRAGLDYWHLLNVSFYEDWQDFEKRNPMVPVYYSSTKGNNFYHHIKYPQNSYFVFGPETRGLPEDILKQNWDRVIKIPMIEDSRSLNLSNAAAVVIYEALRQREFDWR